MKALFAFLSFAHDARRVLAAIDRLALVYVELGLQTCGRVLDAANVRCGRFELLTTMSASRNTRRCANVLHDPNGSFGHNSVSHRLSHTARLADAKRHHHGGSPSVYLWRLSS